jgi:hypothetical protein
VKFWVDITDSDGVRYGQGPVITATQWINTARMDRAGVFSFDMPATDRKAADVDNDRYAYCYGVLDGTVTQLGAGIIKQVQLRVDPAQGPMLRVSGEDLLSDLARYTVGDLEVYQVSDTLSTPDEAYYLNLRNVPSTNSRMDNALDGNAGTYSSFQLYQYRQTYVYVGHTSRFSTLRFNLTAGQSETDGDTMGVEYFSETSGWKDVSGLSDGTDDGSNTLRQSGNVTWTRPDDWVTTTHADKERYWVRIRCGNDQITDTVQVNRLQIYAEEPSDTPVADVMAYAPTGWTVEDADGAATDADTPVLAEFSGQSVLAALIRVAEITGEHFRVGTGKTLVWLGSTLASSGIVAHSSAEGANACAITEMTRDLDSYERISRIYPYGGGLGTDRVTLAAATVSPAAGYTMSTTDNYLEYDAAPSRIDATVTWGDIGNQDDENATDASASNTLYYAAYNYLRRRIAANEVYSIRVVGLDALAAVGETLRVTYHRFVDGYHAINIDDDTLNILEATTEISRDGLRALAMRLATIDVWPDSDAGMVVDLEKRVTALEKGGAVSLGRLAGDNSSGAPGTLSASTTNQIADGIHTHQVSASSDPGEAIALLKTNADGELTLEWLYVTWDLQVAEGDVDILDGALYVDGDLYVNTGPIRLNGGYIGADTDDYSWTWLRGTGGSDTEEVWDFGVSAPWADTLDGHGGYFTFRGRTVYAGSSGAFPALARWHWWAADVTQETYKGAAGIALLKGTGGNGDGTEEMVLSLVAGGDHTLKLQDNAGATSLSITDSDDAEVASIDSDGKATFKSADIGDGTNEAQFAADGELTLAGTARAWRSWDVRPDAMKLPGANPPAEDTIDGFPFLRFDRGTEESVYYVWEVPADFAVGDGSLKGHFEFLVESPPTSGGTNVAENVRMGFEYKKISPDAVFDFTGGTASGYIDETIAVDETAWIIHSTADGTCTTTDWAVGDTILFRFYRDATAAEDTYDNEASAADNDVWVFDFHMMYLVDKLGAAS